MRTLEFPELRKIDSVNKRSYLPNYRAFQPLFDRERDIFLGIEEMCSMLDLSRAAKFIFIHRAGRWGVGV